MQTPEQAVVQEKVVVDLDHASVVVASPRASGIDLHVLIFHVLRLHKGRDNLVVTPR